MPVYMYLHFPQEYLKVLNFLIPTMFAVGTPKFEERSFHRKICRKGADGMANSLDPDQTVLKEQSNLGLHCLPRPVYP